MGEFVMTLLIRAIELALLILGAWKLLELIVGVA